MNRKKNYNSEMLLSFIYTSTLVNILLVVLPIETVSILRYFIYIFIFVLSIVFNKFKFSAKYILFQLIIFIVLSNNLLLTSYNTYVLTDIFSFIFISLVPFYIISTNNLNYKTLMEKWLYFSKFLTLCLPIFLILHNFNIIGYWVIGDLTTLNLLPLLMFLIYYKNTSFINVFSLVLNFVVGLVLGSRSSIVALLITGTLLSIFVKKESAIKNIIRIIISGIIVWLLLDNISLILNAIRNITMNLGIHSRNLELFIIQLERFDLELILSGRSQIYPKVIAFINTNNGLPGGLGITQILTNGDFYHSHNVILDFLSIFGIIGTILFFVWYIFKVILFYRNKKSNSYKTVLCFTFMFYFWSSGLVNAYFLNDIFFLISFAVLLFDNNLMWQSDSFLRTNNVARI